MKKLIIFIIFLLIVFSVYKIYYFDKPIQLGQIEKEELKQYNKFKEEGTISNISYRIHNNYNQVSYNCSKKGYYIDNLNQASPPYYYIITMGEKRTGGYSIFITDLKIDSKENVEVIVHEVKPNFDAATTMSLTYPTCCLELEILPNTITIKNTYGEIYVRRDVYDK